MENLENLKNWAICQKNKGESNFHGTHQPCPMQYAMHIANEVIADAQKTWEDRLTRMSPEQASQYTTSLWLVDGYATPSIAHIINRVFKNFGHRANIRDFSDFENEKEIRDNVMDNIILFCNVNLKKC